MVMLPVTSMQSEIPATVSICASYTDVPRIRRSPSTCNVPGEFPGAIVPNVGITNGPGALQSTASVDDDLTTQAPIDTERCRATYSRDAFERMAVRGGFGEPSSQLDQARSRHA